MYEQSAVVADTETQAIFAVVMTRALRVPASICPAEVVEAFGNLQLLIDHK